MGRGVSGKTVQTHPHRWSAQLSVTCRRKRGKPHSRSGVRTEAEASQAPFLATLSHLNGTSGLISLKRCLGPGFVESVRVHACAGNAGEQNGSLQQFLALPPYLTGGNVARLLPDLDPSHAQATCPQTGAGSWKDTAERAESVRVPSLLAVLQTVSTRRLYCYLPKFT